MSTTVEEIYSPDNENILKLHVGAAIFGDIGADPITDIFNADGSLAPLPAGYFSAGLTDTSGITTNRTISVTDVMSWQSVESQRSDVDSDKLAFQVKFQETLNPVVVALQEGKKLADAIDRMEGVNHYSFDKDPSGVQPRRRCLLIGHDTLRDIIIARYLPNVTLTAIGSMSWQRATEIMNDLTFDAYVDPTYTSDESPNGTASRYFVGGPGLGAIEATNPAIPVPPAWAATHAYALDARITIGGKVLKATVAGTSGSTIPTVPSTVGATVVDGGVTWTRTD